MGAKLVHRESVADQRVNVAMLQIGTLRIELISPLSDDASVARFLRTRGPGLHHIALKSSAAQDDLAAANLAGAELIDETVRIGAERALVGFVHPKSLGGVLIELVQPSSG